MVVVVVVVVVGFELLEPGEAQPVHCSGLC